VIQSPPVESIQASGPEAVHKPGRAKKEDLGVFAKILAGLFRKAGEKDLPVRSAGDEAAGAERLKPGKNHAPDSEEPSALFPGRQKARGKKPAGASGPEIALPAQDAGLLAGAAGVLGQKQGRDGADGASPPAMLRAGGRDPGGAAKIPVKPPPAGTEEIPAEQGESLRPLENLDFGALLGAEGDGAAEGEASDGRKEKTGDYVDSPEEIFSAPPEEAVPGLFPHRLRQAGSGSGDGGRDDPQSRLTRQKDKRREKITLEVQDFRTVNDTASGPLNAQSPRPLETPLTGRGETEILVELRGPGREAPQAADHTWESRAGRSFEDFLARELHQNLNGDIVRHASVVLRDGGEGTIRLALRPESLGNVKIRLEMADNKVTGHIVVESEAALRAFERETASLEQAFRDSGFDGAELDMSLAQGEGGMGRGWNGEDPDRPAAPERLAALRYDAAPERSGTAAAGETAGIFARNGRIAVNILV
jgi:hypothetical protein